jgi:hypothetical protein
VGWDLEVLGRHFYVQSDWGVNEDGFVDAATVLLMLNESFGICGASIAELVELPDVVRICILSLDRR